MANELDLVEKAKKGNDEAFASLVSLYQAYVYNLACRLLNDPALADDASQEAFIRAWKGLPSYRGEARFSTWMYRITYRACMDILGRRKDRLVPGIHCGATSREKWTPGKLDKFAGTWKNVLPAPGRRGSAGR